jgi:hypothetical protein
MELLAMTEAEQPEALRLADWLQNAVATYPQVSEDEPGGYCQEVDQVMDEAAAELRRQHARIAELEQQLSAIGAGGVEPLRSRQCLHQISEPSVWRPIETAPKNSGYVLLRGKHEQAVASGYWLQSAYAGNGAWIWPFMHVNPILWMPLPYPSSADEGGSNG